MGFRGKGFLSDIRKREDIDSLVEFFAENAIGIDILVNNVGVETGAIGFSTIEPEQWQETFATNVFGPMYLTKRISQRMIDKSVPGSIIFITSIHQFTIRRLPDYSASKAALGMIVKELALDLAPCGIRVNGIAPGWVKEDEKGNTYGARYAPLHGSSINPCYIGRAAVFLASEHFSRFTTGAVLTIDGGLSLYNYLVDDSCHDK